MSDFEQIYEEPQVCRQSETLNPRAEVSAAVDAAFFKALAAVICSQFPIASFVAIFLGNTSMKMANAARELAARCDVPAGGKCTAAKIMSIVGLILGIVNSVSYVALIIFFVFYFLILFMAMFMSMMSGY